MIRHANMNNSDNIAPQNAAIECKDGEQVDYFPHHRKPLFHQPGLHCLVPLIQTRLECYKKNTYLMCCDVNNLFFSETSHPANQIVICSIIPPACFSFSKAANWFRQMIGAPNLPPMNKQTFNPAPLWCLQNFDLPDGNCLFTLHWRACLCVEVVGAGRLAAVATC